MFEYQWYSDTINSHEDSGTGVTMLEAAGISGRGRAELAQVLGLGRRFITPTDVVNTLDVDADTAAKKLARWAEDGWVRRVRRGLYIGVPVEAINPAAWSEDALLVASEVWSPCYFTGWTAAHHWALTEQVFRTTVLKTTERVRTSPVRLLDHEYMVSHISEHAFTWGLRTEWVADTRLRFADPARTRHRHSRRTEAWRRDPPRGRGVRSPFSTSTTGISSSSTEIGSGTARCSSGSATSSRASTSVTRISYQPARSGCRRASPRSIPTVHPEGVGSCDGGFASTSR